MNKPLSAMTNINLTDIRWRQRRQIQNIILFISSSRTSKPHLCYHKTRELFLEGRMGQWITGFEHERRIQGASKFLFLKLGADYLDVKSL